MVDLVTIFNTNPRLIPLEQRIALLLPRVPSSHLIQEGQWVRCLHGLYRDDIGFVCEYNPQSDLDTLVAFVARIPEPLSRSAKRKRVERPVARLWSSLEVRAAWGSSQVQMKQDGEFLFRHERYCSGLIMKRVSSLSIVAVAHPPNDMLPFIRAACIRDIPSFTPWAHRFAQYNIRPQQRVRIESGEQKGVIGRPYTITNSVATIVPESEDTPLVDMPLRDLSPFYLLGDSVKDRWSASHGLVVNVNEDQKTLVYVEKDSMNEVSLTLPRLYVSLRPSQIITPMDAVEPFEPARRFYHFKEGDWVNFKQPSHRELHTRRGHIKDVVDGRALVIDERTSAEVSDNISSLSVYFTRITDQCRHPRLGDLRSPRPVFAEERSCRSSPGSERRRQPWTFEGALWSGHRSRF